MPELNLAQAVAAPTAPKVQPAVWLGCLHCYNVGRLVGQRFPCDGIEDVTLGDVHGGTEHVLPGCEEVWCMDSEYLPAGTGEMNQACAAQWGELFAEVGEEQWSALLAWVASGCHVVDADDMPIASQFEERYCGLWESEKAYGEQLADDIGVWGEIPEHLQPYFDLDKWWCDERFGYTVTNAPDGSAYIFRNY